MFHQTIGLLYQMMVILLTNEAWLLVSGTRYSASQFVSNFCDVSPFDSISVRLGYRTDSNN